VNISSSYGILQKRGELKGEGNAEISMANITSFLYLEDQFIQGTLNTTFTLNGTVDVPQITGSIRVSDGSYENVRSGTILKDINLLASIKQDRLLIEKAEAIDGEKGKISLKGWIHKSALTQKKLVLSPGSGSTSVSGDEIVLAGKGFNAQVEEQFKQQNQNLNYGWIDKMERNFAVPQQAMQQFLKDGALSLEGGAL